MFNGQTDDLDIEDNIIIYNSTQISRVFNTFLKGNTYLKMILRLFYLISLKNILIQNYQMKKLY